MQTIQKDTVEQDNFINLALGFCKRAPVASNIYQASVISF